MSNLSRLVPLRSLSAPQKNAKNQKGGEIKKKKDRETTSPKNRKRLVFYSSLDSVGFSYSRVFFIAATCLNHPIIELLIYFYLKAIICADAKSFNLVCFATWIRSMSSWAQCESQIIILYFYSTNWFHMEPLCIKFACFSCIICLF